jgi:3-oxoadipate enol-lactonase
MLMEQVIELEGYSIFTKIEGEGEPIFLLHSYWGSHILFDNLAKMLSVKMKVIRIDLPGHGNSGTPPADYTFDKFAAVLNELLISLNITGKISIIGHSMGGYVAMAFATKYPERIASLVLMHSPVNAPDNQSIRLRNREGSLLLKGKKELLLQVTIPSNFAPENLSSMGQNIDRLNQTSNQVTPKGALGSIYAINHRSNSMGALQKAQYPIMIIVGKYDKVYNVDGQLDEANEIVNAEVLVLSHSGHLGFMEEEDIVFGKLNEFLRNKFAPDTAPSLK